MHDPELCCGCLKAINEAMNDNVESKDAQHMREELCGCGLDANVCKLMRTFIADAEVCTHWPFTLAQLLRSCLRPILGNKFQRGMPLRSPVLPGSLPSHPPTLFQVQRESLVSIGSLAYRSEARKARLMDLGAGPCIIAALAHHAASGRIQEEGLWAAGNLSAGSERLKDRFFEMGVGRAPLIGWWCLGDELGGMRWGGGVGGGGGPVRDGEDAHGQPFSLCLSLFSCCVRADGRRGAHLPRREPTERKRPEDGAHLHRQPQVAAQLKDF